MYISLEVLKRSHFDHTSYQENKIKFIQILVYISNTYRNDVKTLFSFFNFCPEALYSVAEVDAFLSFFING